MGRSSTPSVGRLTVCMRKWCSHLRKRGRSCQNHHQAPWTMGERSLSTLYPPQPRGPGIHFSTVGLAPASEPYAHDSCRMCMYTYHICYTCLMICHSNSHSFSSLGTLHNQGLGCSPQGCQNIKGQRSNVTLGVHSAPFWPRTGSLHRSLLLWSILNPCHPFMSSTHAVTQTSTHTGTHFFQRCWIQVFSYAYFSIVHFIHLHTATEINGCLSGIV